MVTGSAIAECLELLLDGREELGVSFRVHLALENLRRTGHGKIGDLIAQRLLGARGLLRDFRLRRGKHPVRFGFGVGLCLLDGFAAQPFSLSDDLGSPGLSLRNHLGDLLFGAGEALAALFACGQAICDLLLPRSDRPHQYRPDERGTKPNENREDGGLHQQREIHVHGTNPSERAAPVYLRPAGISGLAYANNMAMPNPMMNEASINPSSRKTFACSAGIISG